MSIHRRQSYPGDGEIGTVRRRTGRSDCRNRNNSRIMCLFPKRLRARGRLRLPSLQMSVASPTALGGASFEDCEKGLGDGMLLGFEKPLTAIELNKSMAL